MIQEANKGTDLFTKLTDYFELAFPNKNTRAIVIALLVILVIVIYALVSSRMSEKNGDDDEARKAARKRAQREPNLVLAIVIIALLLMVLATASATRWIWIVGMLPTLLVGYQLFFLWLYQPSLGEQSADVDKKAYKRAHDSLASHFSFKTLFTRYGLPAVLLGITGILLINILVDQLHYFSWLQSIDQNNAKRILLGLKLGAVGAYIYILLELGRRTFRHDITGAVAMWCWVTMVLGPLLAATVAFLWTIDSPPPTGWWGGGVVLFFAGFAPRRVIAAIEQAAGQLLKVGTPTVVDTRLIPLSKVRGISPQIEERLSEEGIVDVNSLASAEPVRLMRNTSFDMRQILNWIDEAILICTLPRGWDALEEEGITGAIDLAWYYPQMKDPSAAATTPQMKRLAEKAKVDPENLVATIGRLFEDKQVQYIWALYNGVEHSNPYSGSGTGNGNGKAKDPDEQGGTGGKGESVNKNASDAGAMDAATKDKEPKDAGSRQGITGGTPNADPGAVSGAGPKADPTPGPGAGLTESVASREDTGTGVAEPVSGQGTVVSTKEVTEAGGLVVNEPSSSGSGTVATGNEGTGEPG